MGGACRNEFELRGPSPGAENEAKWGSPNGGCMSFFLFIVREGSKLFKGVC